MTTIKTKRWTEISIFVEWWSVSYFINWFMASSVSIFDQNVYSTKSFNWSFKIVKWLRIYKFLFFKVQILNFFKFIFLSFRSGYRKTLKSLPKYIYNGHFFGYIFPPFKWLPEYKWRQDFGFDLMSGFTTGVMLIPQGF